jgi:predicted nucleotidyltransferase
MPFRRQPLTLADLRRQRDRILELAHQRGVSNIRVFGSVARGEASLTSDVDLLLDMDPERSILDLGGFAIEVAELLESRVDVVETESLGGRMRERVLEEAVSL